MQVSGTHTKLSSTSPAPCQPQHRTSTFGARLSLAKPWGFQTVPAQIWTRGPKQTFPARSRAARAGKQGAAQDNAWENFPHARPGETEALGGGPQKSATGAAESPSAMGSAHQTRGISPVLITFAVALAFPGLKLPGTRGPRPHPVPLRGSLRFLAGGSVSRQGMLLAAVAWGKSSAVHLLGC